MAHHKPDFLGVGFAKSGTSWIFKQLNNHPAVKIPELKELRYLLEPWHIPKASWTNKLFSSHWHYKRYRKMFFKRVAMWLKSPSSLKSDTWYRHFLLGRHSDEWYAQLFDEQKVSGEITPGYVYMSEPQIAELSNRFPNLKIIIMLRNPVERTWSHVKMNLAKHASKNVASLSEVEINKRVAEILHLTPQYSDCIQNWKRHFSNVFIGTQDDIIHDPVKLLKQLQEFLGVEVSIENEEETKGRVNQGLTGDMPLEVKNHLSNHFKSDNSKLYDMLGIDYIRDWN